MCDTAVHYYDPALSVLVVLVSRNAFRAVSALQSIVFFHRKQFFLRLTVSLFQSLRLTAESLVVLQLTVNPIQTLIL